MAVGNLQTIVDTLGSVAPYDALGEGRLVRLAEECRVRRLDRHEVLLHDGAQLKSTFILTRGYLVRSIGTPEGRSVRLNDTHPVTSFGCAAAFDATPHVGVVEAAEQSEVITVPLVRVRGLLEECAPFALAMARTLAHSSVRQTQYVRELLFPVPVRVARLLCRRCEETGGVVLEMSKSGLAEMLATVPETLSRALGTLRDQGLLEVQGRTVHVIDADGLRRYAQL